MDSIVGSPKVLPRHETESMRQSQLLQGVWSSACADEAEPTDDMHMLMSFQEGAEGHTHADEGADEGGNGVTASSSSSRAIPTKPHVQVEDFDTTLDLYVRLDGVDMMSSVLGQMSEVGELDNMSSLAWPSQVQHDVPPMHALLDGAEMRVHRDPQAKEMDEVEWLRRTYETVYSPAAR